MKRSRRSTASRDQGASAFSPILMRLCDGARAVAAALVDPAGETVDYAGGLEPYDQRVMAAEWQLVVGTLARSKVPHWPETREILVRGASKSFALITLSDGYVIVMQLLPRSFAVSQRAVAEAVREIASEAGIENRLGGAVATGRWSRVEVRTVAGDVWRPEAIWIESSWSPPSVLGVYADAELDSREIGYRARLESGAEITLVREPMGSWYADGLPVA